MMKDCHKIGSLDYNISCVTFVRPRLFIIWMHSGKVYENCLGNIGYDSDDKVPVYYVDILSGRMMMNIKSTSDMIEGKQYFSVYNDQNQTIYLLSKYEKRHKSVALIDVISWEMFKDYIVYGWIRNIERRDRLHLASELKILIMSYVDFDS